MNTIRELLSDNDVFVRLKKGQMLPVDHIWTYRLFEAEYGCFVDMDFNMNGMKISFLSHYSEVEPKKFEIVYAPKKDVE